MKTENSINFFRKNEKNQINELYNKIEWKAQTIGCRVFGFLFGILLLVDIFRWFISLEINIDLVEESKNATIKAIKL